MSLKFQWERAVGATSYVASVKLVARVLASFANADGSSARPGVDRLMAEASLKRRTVLYALETLADDGWLKKADRSGTKRHYFDEYQLLIPRWINDLGPGRPDCRREHERFLKAQQIRESRQGANVFMGPDQVHTYAPDQKIETEFHTVVLGANNCMDQVHTTARSGAYARENTAGQMAPIPTSRPTLEMHHGAPSVAGTPRVPHPAEPDVPHGVELASARSTPHMIDPAESSGPAAAPLKKRRSEPFRGESNAYVAAAKKLDWDTVADVLGKWREARADEYTWARKIAIGKMGRGGSLKTARGFERADRLTYDSALRMHLEDGSWHETLLDPLDVPEIPLAPLALNDLGDVGRRAALKAHFEVIRQMDFDSVRDFGLRFKKEEPELFDAACQAAMADIRERPGLNTGAAALNQLACMQILNTTKDWPAWMTDAFAA